MKNDYQGPNEAGVVCLRLKQAKVERTSPKQERTKTTKRGGEEVRTPDLEEKWVGKEKIGSGKDGESGERVEKCRNEAERPRKKKN